MAPFCADAPRFKYKGDDHFRKLNNYINKGNWLIFFQLALINLIFLRILVAFVVKIDLIFDWLLVFTSFAILGVGWIVYFCYTTWPEKLAKISRDAGLIELFDRRRMWRRKR